MSAWTHGFVFVPPVFTGGFPFLSQIFFFFFFFFFENLIWEVVFHFSVAWIFWGSKFLLIPGCIRCFSGLVPVSVQNFFAEGFFFFFFPIKDGFRRIPPLCTNRCIKLLRHFTCLPFSVQNHLLGLCFMLTLVNCFQFFFFSNLCSFFGGLVSLLYNFPFSKSTLGLMLHFVKIWSNLQFWLPSIFFFFFFNFINLIYIVCLGQSFSS